MYKVAVVAPEKFEMTAEHLTIVRPSVMDIYHGYGSRPQFMPVGDTALTLNLFDITLLNVLRSNPTSRSPLNTTLPLTFTIFGDGQYVMGALFKEAYVEKIESSFFARGTNSYHFSMAAIKVYSWTSWNAPASPKEKPVVISRQIIIYRGKR